jgi:hypothetical protein
VQGVEFQNLALSIVLSLLAPLSVVMQLAPLSVVVQPKPPQAAVPRASTAWALQGVGSGASQGSVAGAIDADYGIRNSGAGTATGFFDSGGSGSFGSPSNLAFELTFR